MECPFTIVIDQLPLGGPYVAAIPALPGVEATGGTVVEAATRVIEAGQTALANGRQLLPREEWEKALVETGPPDGAGI